MIQTSKRLIKSARVLSNNFMSIEFYWISKYKGSSSFYQKMLIPLLSSIDEEQQHCHISDDLIEKAPELLDLAFSSRYQE